MSACLARELIRHWLSGDLGPDLAATVGDHVAGCPGCQSILDAETDRVDLRRWLASGRRGGLADDNASLGALLSRLRTVAQGPEGSGPSGGPEPEPAGGSVPEPRPCIRPPGAFELLEELGRGGMGIVHRGWDRALRREVAIKLLRPEMSEPAHRLRLVREAQLAARFRHDHAVLIYSVVDPPDGPPYLVMEYIAGSSLAERLSMRPRPASRSVATWIAQVADALEAAHAAGLIHRDVKPGNILIEQASGRAKIADFGLARAAAGQATVTHVGSAAGTPTFMSPEQARGEPVLDPRTDVYSLGATLYASLTGVAPFQGEPHQVLRQIIETDPRPPRQLNDAVPRDLETICLKAMEREPMRRYRTAAALADDLRRWLRGEPIQARPAGRPERAYRWCRRNPRVAGLSAALVVALAAGFAGVLWQWRKDEQNARRAEVLRGEADANFRDARAGFQQARRVVDEFYARFYEQGLLKVPGLEGVRHEILDEMLGYYKGFIAQHGEDPSLRRDLAEACYRMGRLTFDRGNRADALALLRRALQEFDSLGEVAPHDRKDRARIASCLNVIGQLEYTLGQHEPARRTYERGIAAMEGLIRDDPSDLQHRRRLAAIHGNFASLYLRQGDRARARLEYRSALDLQQDLVQKQPAVLEFLNDLGMTYNNLAMAVDDREEGIVLLHQGLDVRREVVRREPTNSYYQRNLARSHQNLGVALNLRGKHAEALKDLEESRRLMEQVVGEQPGVVTYQADLAQSLENLGSDLAELGRLDAARAACERARTIYRKLLHGNPQDLVIQEGLTTVERALAQIEQASRPPAVRLANGAQPAKHGGGGRESKDR